MSDWKVTLEKRRADTQKKFDVLTEERKQLSEQSATLQRRLNAIQEEQIRLQGEWRQLDELEESMKGEPKTEQQDEKPKGAKKG